MLSIQNLSFRYPRAKKLIYDDFSLDLPSGGIYGLLGSNGVGKSTLLYLIAGALRPLCGSVTLNGRDTVKRSPATMGDIFFVPEEFSLPPVTLMDYARDNGVFYPKFSQADLERNLVTFSLTSDMNLAAMSMGQKKKALMCFALATNTALLIMDEPTNGLDIPGKSAFRKFIAGAVTDERTIIISTHQVRDIDRLLDHVVILGDNKLLLNSSISDIARKFRFVNTDDRHLINNALYSQTTLDGSSIILPGGGDDDTKVNLETLFEMVINNPHLIESGYE